MLDSNFNSHYGKSSVKSVTCPQFWQLFESIWIVCVNLFIGVLSHPAAQTNWFLSGEHIRPCQVTYMGHTWTLNTQGCVFSVQSRFSVFACWVCSSHNAFKQCSTYDLSFIQPGWKSKLLLINIHIFVKTNMQVKIAHGHVWWTFAVKYTYFVCFTKVF